MKKILFICFVLLFSTALMAKDPTVLLINSQTKEVYGEYTFEQFKTFAQAANILLEIKKSEENSRVFIDLNESPWIMVDGEYHTTIRAIWTDEKGNTIKEITEKVTLTLDKDQILPTKTIWDDIDKYYTSLSKVGFPVVIIVLIIFAWAGL